MHVTPDLPTIEDAFTQLAQLVARIRANDQRGPKQLHALILNCAGRYFGARVPAEEAQDLIHDVYVIAFEALRQNRVREPRRLMGYVATVARRRYAAYVERRV